LFRTELYAHELITVGYTRYFYNARSCTPPNTSRCIQPPPSPNTPSGFGATPEIQDEENRGQPVLSPGNTPQLPDKHMFTIEATMWW
jgi:hypothetical protein